MGCACTVTYCYILLPLLIPSRWDLIFFVGVQVAWLLGFSTVVSWACHQWLQWERQHPNPRKVQGRIWIFSSKQTTKVMWTVVVVAVVVAGCCWLLLVVAVCCCVLLFGMCICMCCCICCIITTALVLLVLVLVVVVLLLLRLLLLLVLVLLFVLVLLVVVAGGIESVMGFITIVYPLEIWPFMGHLQKHWSQKMCVGLCKATSKTNHKSNMSR